MLSRLHPTNTDPLLDYSCDRGSRKSYIRVNLFVAHKYMCLIILKKSSLVIKKGSYENEPDYDVCIHFAMLCSIRVMCWGTLNSERKGFSSPNECQVTFAINKSNSFIVRSDMLAVLTCNKYTNLTIFNKFRQNINAI